MECADAVLANQIEQHEHNVVDKNCKEEGATQDPHQEMLKKMLRCLDLIKAAGQNTPNMESTLVCPFFPPIFQGLELTNRTCKLSREAEDATQRVSVCDECECVGVRCVFYFGIFFYY